MFDQLILTIRIDADLKNHNTGQTKHWSTAHREKSIMVSALKNGRILYPGDGNLTFKAFKKDVMPDPFDKKVDISVKRIFVRRQKPIDPDSITRGNCKQTIDALCDAGILIDDSHEYVGRVLGLQSRGEDQDKPSIEISFWEFEDEQSFSRS